MQTFPFYKVDLIVTIWWLSRYVSISRYVGMRISFGARQEMLRSTLRLKKIYSIISLKWIWLDRAPNPCTRNILHMHLNILYFVKLRKKEAEKSAVSSMLWIRLSWNRSTCIPAVVLFCELSVLSRILISIYVSNSNDSLFRHWLIGIFCNDNYAMDCMMFLLFSPIWLDRICS